MANSSQSDLSNLRLAVLIDADNVPRNCIKAVMEEIAIYGTPTVKRIYGDWTSPNIGGWKQSLLENALTPIQQYGYTVGKNSTDSAMIIDAMDILYGGKIDGFCIVSSDSDFTRLAIRLREAGMKVLGFGERKTPQPFIVACDKFIYIEVIRDKAKQESAKTLDKAEEKPAEKTEEKAAPKKSRSSRKSTEPKSQETAEPKTPETKPQQGVPQEVRELILSSVEDIAGEDGYAFMGELGNLLLKKKPDFDPRNYGFPKLTNLIKSLGLFEIDVRQTGNANTKHIYLREKENP